MESDSGLTTYELRVKRNIEENKRVLKSLGLLNPILKRNDSVKKTVRRSNVAVKKRSSFRPYEDSPASPSLPARRTRRSSSILKSQGYDEFDDVPIVADEENTPPHKRRKTVTEPIFGPIEGVSVGDWWSTRIECSAAGVHRPTVAGIHGKLEEGCYSIALSGGYEDDIDCGEYFTYTGSGGRDLKGTKTNPKNLRTAPQTKDQVLEGPNAALALNIENQRPVRVIRGYKLPSPYAPEEGYRYDGLYSVEKCWTATGLSGFKVYKYALKRLGDQDPPPWVDHGTTMGKSSSNFILNVVKDNIRMSSPADSPNAIQNVSEDNSWTDKQTPVTLKRKRTFSNSKHSPEEITQEQRSPAGSLNAMQHASEVEDGTVELPVTSKRKRTFSNSKHSPEEITQEQRSPADSLNAMQHASEVKDGTVELPVTSKRKRTFSNSKHSPEEITQEQRSPADSLNAMQHASEVENGTVELTQMRVKRNRRSINSNLGSEGTFQESSSTGCATMGRNNPNNRHSDMNTSSYRDRLNDQGKLANGVNGSTLNEKSNEANNLNTNENEFLNTNKSIVSPSNNKLKYTNGEVGTAPSSPVFDCHVQLTPLRGKYVLDFSSQIDKTELKDNEKSLKSTGKKVTFSPEVTFNDEEGKKVTFSPEVTFNDEEGKKVTFSPEVTFNDEEGNKYTGPISSLDCKLNYPKMRSSVEPIKIDYPQGNDQDIPRSPPNKTGGESKKQASILRYFGPVIIKTDEKRVSSRGILLRSNRRSFVSNSFISVPESRSVTEDKKSVPFISLLQDKSKVFKVAPKKKSANLGSFSMSLDKKTKSSSTDKTQEEESQQNLTSSPVKPCSVALVRLNTRKYTSTLTKPLVKIDTIEEPFLGWDFDKEDVEFLGFDLGEEPQLLFRGFEENPQSLTNVLLMFSVIKKISEDL